MGIKRFSIGRRGQNVPIDVFAVQFTHNDASCVLGSGRDIRVRKTWGPIRFCETMAGNAETW